MATDRKVISEAAAILGRLGGLKGGPIGGKIGGPRGGRVRAERLSPARRKAIARKAAQARWAREQTKKTAN